MSRKRSWPAFAVVGALVLAACSTGGVDTRTPAPTPEGNTAGPDDASAAIPGLTEVERPTPEHEEADLQVERFPVADAVEMVLAGEIVNATAVASISALAAARSLGRGPGDLRPTDAAWTDRPERFEARRRAR